MEFLATTGPVLASKGYVQGQRQRLMMCFLLPCLCGSSFCGAGHGNTFPIASCKVQKLLAAACGRAHAMSASTSNSANLWYCSLGCLAWQSSRRLWNAAGSGIKFMNAEFNAACVVPFDGCVKGKMNKPRSYEQFRGMCDKPSRPFQHIQADIMANRGKMSERVSNSSLFWFACTRRIVCLVRVEAKIGEAVTDVKLSGMIYVRSKCTCLVSPLALVSGTISS